MKYYHPTRIYNYSKAILDLETIIIKNFPSAKRILVVSGVNHFKESIHHTEVFENLKKYECKELFIKKVEPNWIQIRELIKECNFFKPDIIIGIGGGSVLDSIKPVATLFNSETDISELMNRTKNPPKRKINMIAIPTTSGTGSEVTPFSVITNSETGIKQSIGPEEYFPDIAIIDHRLNYSVPKKVKLDVGLDTMAHALEAIWSKNNQYISNTLAWEALILALENISLHIDNPKNATASLNMAKASNLAGIAFSNTFTAVCHSLSFPLGNKFKLSHGESCSWTLPACIDKSINILLELKPSHISKDFILNLSKNIRKIRNKYYKELDVRILKLTKTDKEFIVKNAFQPLLNNWNVEYNENDLFDILNNI